MGTPRCKGRRETLGYRPTMATTQEPQVYLNGEFILRSAAKLDIEDRGTMFADGVYEVIRYYAGRPFAINQHQARLHESLVAIGLTPPAMIDRLDAISDELIQRNGLTDAKLYWQVTRGGAPRDLAFPADPSPTVLGIAYPEPPLDRSAQLATARAMLTDDLRWHRCSIKSLMLLPNVLAKNAAIQAGMDEAILHRDGTVTEGTATSVFIVNHSQVQTHPANQWVLDGITRRAVLDLSRKAGLSTIERVFNTQELLGADEVFLCGTTTHIAAVVAVDAKTIGAGQVGPVTAQLHGALIEHIRQACRR